ncbi:MAG TPA: stalk domain-containing protein [Candidatus Limnocylindrales bacterium]|nr:stalk domain-containing protein [Candidatus Limnocylindrales bacterium]
MLLALTFAAYTVTLDGRVVLPRAHAAVASGHVLLPVRALGEALGADVGYDGRAHTITVQRGAHVATIPARGAVRIVNGRAYAPLRAVATAFGLGVGYEARTRTVALDDRVSAPKPAFVAAPAGNDVPPIAVTLQPSANARVHEAYPAISARFAGAASIDPRSVHLIVDGNDVSGLAAVIGDQVLFTPRTAFSPGTHTVSLTARDARGIPLVQQWSFDDTFEFVTMPMPPPTPFPITAIWIDRWIVPGTNTFDVYVEGAPGITGYVAVDGVGSYFPLMVYSANAYVAHVYVPNGVNEPYARVAARVTLPNGDTQTILLPQRLSIITPPIVRPTPTPVPIYRAAPRRPLGVPSASPTPLRPRFERPTPTPTATPLPTARPTATPSPRPAPVRTRVPLRRPSPTPSPQ